MSYQQENRRWLIDAILALLKMSHAGFGGNSPTAYSTMCAGKWHYSLCRLLKLLAGRYSVIARHQRRG